jgi:hypothetical protein
MGKTPFYKKASRPIDKEFFFFLKAAFIIILVCLLCEVFVFNARHFVTYWGDEQMSLNEQIYQNKTNYYTVNITHSELYVPTIGRRSEIVLFNIEKRVVTVYIDAVFDENIKMQSFQINYGDEEQSNRTTAVFNVINGVEESKYVTLHTSGKVSHIRVIYRTQNPATSIRDIILNKPVPLKIFKLRVFLFSTVAFCIVLIKRKKLFSLPLKSNSRKQIILTAGIMLAFIFFLFVLMLLTAPFSLKRPFKENFANESKILLNTQYNTYIVDAILNGHTYMDIEPPKDLLTRKDPYPYNDPFLWDVVFFNGKFYSYFGIVQVLVLALPYKLITGNYIPTRVAVFVFSALASIFLMLIWRRLVFRYMKNMPLGMYALGQLTVAMCSALSFLTIIPWIFEVAISSALFFTTLGFWLVLGNSTRGKARWIEAASGSLCIALAVGCRPSFLFFFPLIPVVLFEELKELWNDKKRFLGLCACVVVPYTLVACGLMWYNYIRFGSVFEFGMKYQLTGDHPNSNYTPMGDLIRFIISFFSFLLPTFHVSASFPFLSLSSIDSSLTYKSPFYYNTPSIGLLALPITWFIFSVGMIKRKIGKHIKTFFHLITAMICLGFVQIAIIVFLSNAVVQRYTVDFFWIFVLSGLFCAYLIYEGMTEHQERIMQIKGKLSVNLIKMTERIIYFAMIFSILLLFLTTIGWDGEGFWFPLINNNPSIYYAIQRLLGFNTW